MLKTVLHRTPRGRGVATTGAMTAACQSSALYIALPGSADMNMQEQRQHDLHVRTLPAAFLEHPQAEAPWNF